MGACRLLRCSSGVVSTLVSVAVFLAPNQLGAQEAIPFHEALNKGWIEATILQFSQEKLSLRVVATSPQGAKRVEVRDGTWIDLAAFPTAGSLFLKSGKTLNLSRSDRKDSYQPETLSCIALSPRLFPTVPVLDSVYLHKEDDAAERKVSRAGHEPLAEGILSEAVKGKDEILGMAAALVMVNQPGLTTNQLQLYVDRYFNKRRTERQQKELDTGDRRGPLWVWNSDESHLKLGFHYLEKARSRESGAPVPKKLTAADACAKGFLQAEVRKGILSNSDMIVRVTRTPKATGSSAEVTFPIGTYFLFDDREDGEPAKFFPITEMTIDLFGEIKEGAHLPCLNASYKRRISTRRTIAVKFGFDEKAAKLWADRPESHRLQMAVEAVLLEHPDLTDEQIQYHIVQVGAPGVEDLALTEELIAAAKNRITGGHPSVPITPPTTSEPEKPKTVPEPSRPKPSRPEPEPNPYGVTLSEGMRGVRIDPNVPRDPDGLLAREPNGKAVWKTMVQHVPEYPEEALIGNWSPLPRGEAIQSLLSLKMDTLEEISAATGESIPPEMVQTMEAMMKLNDNQTFYYTGNLGFRRNGEVRGAINGPNDSSVTPIDAKWKFDGMKTIRITPGNEIKHFIFGRDGRLIYHDERSGRLIVMRKY